MIHALQQSKFLKSNCTDEESVVPKGSDEKLVTKLNQIFNENRTTKSPFYGRGRKSPLEFIVHHFAGDVIYNSTDFLEKNKDSMAEGLLKQIESSKVPILKAAAGLDTDGKGNKQKSTKQTLSTKFKSDLDTLMTTLRATTPHFVRCIKPNNEQKSDKFDSSVVLNQLKYSGLFEAIRIRKAGYAVRMPYQQFLKRYKLCITGSVPATIKPDAKAFSEYILANLHDKVMTLIAKKHFEKSKGKPNSLPAADAVENKRQWVVGRTKVFIRTQEYKYFLDELRVQSTGNAAANIQKLIRGYLMRKKFRDIMGDRLAAMEAQRREEAYERKLMRVEEGISATVEQAWRDDYDLQQRLETARRNRIIEERKRVEKLKHESAIKIQRMVRGKVYRKRGRIQMCEKMLETAIMRREEDLLQKAMAMPSVMNVTSKLIRIYQRSCKELILAVLNESYVNNQLLEAMEVGSADLLKQAIRLADKSHMDYLSNYSAAKVALHNAQVLKSVSGLLASVLSKCVTVPKLLASVDKLQILVKEATAMGLAGEVSVQEAAMRMTKIRSLIILRDKLRFSVEICSPSKMKRFASFQIVQYLLFYQ